VSVLENATPERYSQRFCVGVKNAMVFALTNMRVAMSETVNTSGRAGWPISIVDPIVNRPETWKRSIRSSQKADIRRSPVSDIALLYPEAVLVSSDAFAWQDIRVIHLWHSLSEVVVPASDCHCLLLNLGTPLHLNAHLGKRKFEGKVRAGKVAIIPAGSSWSCRSRGSHSRNALLLYLRPLFVRSVASGYYFSYEEIALTPQIGFRNRHILHVAMSLLQELNEANVVGKPYADSLAIGLAMQMVRRYSSLRDVRIGRGGMSPHKLRKALGLIDHHLAEEEEGRVPLRVVAKEVGISYFHFSRAFKQSIGTSPTNYIAERRIERAKKLIQETDLPISEIAIRSGFSSQSHFTTCFRRFAKVTPKSFRKGI
jgi:AraC family transcriptional regulator